MSFRPIKPLFPLGELICSPGAESPEINIVHLLTRHVTGDWGDITDEAIEANRRALDAVGGLISVYRIVISGQEKIVWITTEGDRSQTVAIVLDDPTIEKGYFDDIQLPLRD